MSLYVVTGGAGFIGSNIAASLDARGDDIIIVDTLGVGEKWRNISQRRLRDIVPPEQALSRLEPVSNQIAAVLHMGAVSSTLETDVDLIVENNFRYSCGLWDWCARARVPFIYASSAATYGDGASGFEDRDDAGYLSRLRPLNAYGWSKHLFDRWVIDTCDRADPKPPSWAGLKFFNVFGPNEFHKGPQRSNALQIFQQIKAGQPVKLFQSHRSDYPDGGQLRDFVWVEDCADIAIWLADRPNISGMYNIGSGQARSFADLAVAIGGAMGRKPDIEYIPMPDVLRSKYQYFTQAATGKLETAGCPVKPRSLDDGVQRYVLEFLTTCSSFR